MKKFALIKTDSYAEFYSCIEGTPNSITAEIDFLNTDSDSLGMRVNLLVVTS